ncbi:MAG: hypothetical protein IRY84_05090 [Thermobispora bispora]|nr:hypothetical protein [Thermobispora bispora]
MISSGLARLAAVGVAALTVMASGLVTTPAAASATPAKRVVSVSTPTVSSPRYAGLCPATLTFSAKVKLKVRGKTTIAYRWLRSGGSKSAVKTRTVKGMGVKTVALVKKVTFTKDAKGWQALQLLSPRKVTTKKAYFSVSCHVPVELPPDKPAPWKPHAGKRPAFVKAYVDVPDYIGACPPSGGVTARGLIKAARPSLVTYRWIHNGNVVDWGKIKVVGDKKVSYTFKPDKSHRGWVTLDIVSPRHGRSDRDTYRVECKKEEPPPPPVEATASVTAPASYTGTCPVNRVFTGTVTVNRIDAGGTTVQYRWAGPSFQGPTETLTFAQGDPLSKSVSHTAQVTTSGIVQRWIEILSPNTAASGTAEVQVECQALQIQVLDIQTSIDASACGTPGYGPAVTVRASIRVNGPVRVEYEWEFNNGLFTVPGSFETTEPKTVTVSHRLESSPFTASGVIRARIRITSHDVRGAAIDFTPPPCPTS